MNTGSKAIYTIENDTLYLDSDVPLGGVQFTFTCFDEAELHALSALQNFEVIRQQVDASHVLLMAYSMSGQLLPAGKQALLHIGAAQLDAIALSDPSGGNVFPIKGNEVGLYEVEGCAAQFCKAFPNPFEHEVQLDYISATGHPLMLRITNAQGQTVHEAQLPSPCEGRYSYRWLASVPSGIYFATLLVEGIPAHTIKLVVK